MKIKLEIELDYYDGFIGNDPDEIDWFNHDVILNPAKGEGLSLFSDCIGDVVGDVRVLRIINKKGA